MIKTFHINSEDIHRVDPEILCVCPDYYQPGKKQEKKTLLLNNRCKNV